MFYFALDHHKVAYQVTALINSHNRLSTKKSVANIQNGHTDYIVETHGQWVLGAVGLDRQGYTFTEIKHLVVHSEWRRKGIARHLLKRALRVVDTKMVYATIREDNKGSLKLFKSLGFQNAGGYATKNHRVILFVRVSPQWKQMKSDSKSHWLDVEASVKKLYHSTLTSPEPGLKAALNG